MLQTILITAVRGLGYKGHKFQDDWSYKETLPQKNYIGSQQSLDPHRHRPEGNPRNVPRPQVLPI